MKKICALIVFITAAKSFATTQEILCQKIPSQSNGAFTITFGNSNFDPSSNYYAIQYSFWSYSYSSAQLTCSENAINLSRKEKFKCIGYESTNGKIEISLDLDRGEGTAQVHNIGSNFYAHETEDMILPCRVRSN